MISLKKIFKKNFFPFIYSSTIIGSAFFGYFAYKIKRNNANFVRNQENDNFKDTTRLSYDFYGINWGVASDNMIKDKLDSGDSIFLKYDCNECINIADFFKCQILHFGSFDENYDNLGLIYRSSEDDVFVFFENFGRMEKMNYCDFLALPYFKEISLRKLSYIEDDLKLISKRINKNFKEFNKKYDVNPLFLGNNFRHSIYRDFLEKNELLLFDVSKLECKNFINGIDQEKPEFLKPGFKFNNKIVVRSRINKELVSG